MITEGLTKFGPPAESHIQMVMQEYNLTRQELTGASKMHKLMHPRRELYMRLLCTPCKWVYGVPQYRSLPQVGRIVGGRDHTTALYGIRAYAVEFLDLPWKSSVAEIRVAYIAKSQQDEGMERAA
jgi:chromosomal replication initiation ATPase DnaA